MENIQKPILMGLKVILVILGVIFMYQVLNTYQTDAWSDIQEATPFFDKDSDVYGEAQTFMGKLGTLITFNNILLGIAVLAIVAFGILGVVKNFKKALPFLIGAAILGIIVLVAYYGMSSGEVLSSWETGDEIISSDVSKKSDAGIKTVYILLGLSLAGVIYGEVSKLFK